MNALESIIRDEIRASGPMRFDRYMALALYHPEHGYYAGPRRVGRGGDYFTSVSVGPLFGHLLARQAQQIAAHLGEPIWIIEQGVHDGQLAHDILTSARINAGTFSALRYGIVEPSLAARRVQQQTLKEFGGQVVWFGSLAEAAGETRSGLFLSNELVDAFPVRLIVREGQGWRERHVSVDGQLGWIDLPVRDDELARAMDDLPLPEFPGYCTEINLKARRWINEVAGVLQRGVVLTIDYGFPASIYYAPFRRDGTLTTYAEHRRDDQVLLAPGERDITAHVDFTALVRAGEASGLRTRALVDQQRFLTGIAHDELSGAAAYQPSLAQQTRAWQMLTHPQHLGTRFQVLVQTKNCDLDLNGLRFARPGGWD